MQLFLSFHFLFTSLPAAPSEPGAPEVHTIRGDEMTLTWTEPLHHGGRPITGYHIELREDFDLPWTRVTTEPVPDTTHRVTGLKPGQEYEFRIVGVTDVGVGRPSEPSSPPRQAREPAGECIDRNPVRWMGWLTPLNFLEKLPLTLTFHSVASVSCIPYPLPPHFFTQMSTTG